MRIVLFVGLALTFSSAVCAQTGVWSDGRGNFSSRIDGRGINPPAPNSYDDGYRRRDGYVRRYMPPQGEGFGYSDGAGNGFSIRNNVRPACREIVERNNAGGITRTLTCDPS